MQMLSHGAITGTAHLQQLGHNWQDVQVADVDGVIPIGLLLIADIPQVKDSRQQREDPARGEENMS